jgi:iron complex outermembrane recepter protein
MLTNYQAAGNNFKGLYLFAGKVLLIFFTAVKILYSSSAPPTVSGIVLNSQNGEPVVSAVIHVLNSDIFITTRTDGTFDIHSLEEGRYKIRVTHIAYQENLLDITVAQEVKNLRILLIPKSIEISPVIVSDRYSVSKFDEITELSGVIKGKELQRDLGFTLASTLKNETGLAIRSMGPAPARPVIRGLGGDRVMISEDGRKTVDLSATSPDHAVTVDPFSVSRIEVLRGPKVLLTTSTTIGGVVNVVRPEIPDELHENIHGSVGFFGESANLGYLGSLITDVPIDPFSVRLELSRRESGDLKTPAGKLKNSYARNFIVSSGASYINDFGFLGGSFRRFELEYGVPGGFVGAHPDGVDIEMYREQMNLGSKINFNSDFFESADISLSNVLYRHKEFEASGRIGSEFKITNIMGFANLNHKGIFKNDRNSGTAGLSFESRDFKIGGFVFTPKSKSLNFSLYLFETFSTDRFGFEFGARYNFDRITPEKEKPDASIGHIREKIFNTYSLSFSILYELSDIILIGGNVSKSSRVPTIEELYSEGPHLAAYSYEIGNPELEAESGFGSELFVFHQFNGVFFNLIFFRNELHNYIIPRNTGEINYATFLPIYATTGVHALLYGIEGQSEIKLTGSHSDGLSLSLNASYTRGRFASTDESLPQIPPFKGNVEVKFNTTEYVFGLGSEAAAGQKKVDTFEEPTAGYIIFNAFAQYFLMTGDLIHNFSFNTDNIFNTEYRNHLSRVKSILPEPGRSFRITYRMYF